MMKSIYILTLLLFFFTSIGFANNEEHAVKINSTDSTAIQVAGSENQHDAENSHSNEHEGGLEPLLFVIVALIIGAATRHFFRKIPLPFTVLLLLFGIGLGLLNRFNLFEGWGGAFGESLTWAGNINPHAILFIFLPILIFEAAFGMDFHTFKKTATNSIILAVPGIIVAIVLSAVLAIGIKYFNIGLFGWEWSMALMFGAVISATDPVAVVALLKELGASKKLGTLIEGESLLNDGTAIVIFMVFFTSITGVTSDTNAFVEFGRVVMGGTIIGLIIAGVVIAWVKRVFNDALVEISVIIAAAYLTFFVAENFMHVSGVLALVALGLAMTSIGKTRISPEVGHFLHEFWELAAFIANVLIFIIVGVVISQRVEFSASDFLILGIFFIGIHIIRGIMLLMFYPLMKKFGYGINRNETLVLWYGALRGAIGLALALVVLGIDDKFISNDPVLAQKIKNQFFFITSGLVTLTLLINATTIKFLLNYLGMTKIAPAKALMILSANDYMRSSAENAVERLKTDRFLSNSDWQKVEAYLPKGVAINYDKNVKIDTVAEMRKRVLEKEKSSYWYQFKEGMLSSSAVRTLSGGIDEMLDEGGIVSLSHRKDLEDLMKTPKSYKTLQSIPFINKITQHYFYERLAKGYDCARGFIEAQDEALKLVESMQRSYAGDDENTKHLAQIEEEINENKIEGLTFLRNMKKHYSDIYNAISTKHAIRSLLNYELKTVERLFKNGRIDSGESEKLTEHIEERMKELLQSSLKIKLPDISELIAEVEWFKDLKPEIKAQLVKFIQKKTFDVGHTIIKQDSKDDGLFIISRGTVNISIGNDIIDTLGHGSIFGEMAILTKNPRLATATVESPVTALWISNSHLLDLIKSSPILEEKLWGLTSRRYAENLLRKVEPFTIWKPKQFNKWLSEGKTIKTTDASLPDYQNKFCILVDGEVYTKSGEKISSPAIISLEDSVVKSEIRLFIGEKI